MAYYRYYLDPKAAELAAIFSIGGMLILGAVAVGVWACADQREKNYLKELNSKIERDLDVDLFKTQTIIFDETDENLIIRITGSSAKEDFVAADYKVSPQDFYGLKRDKNDVVGIKEHGYKFIKNLLDILYRSEFIDQKAENLALVNGGELVLNVSKPHVDHEAGCVSYSLTIAKIIDTDVKLGTFVVSAPLDEQLEQDPHTIYSLPKEKVEVEKLSVKTHKNVLQVELHDDYTAVV